MRVEYIKPFVEASSSILETVVGGTIKRGALALRTASTPVLGVTVIVGLAGDVHGRVVFDMTAETALAIAGRMNGEVFSEFDDMVKATINELANMITGQAITQLSEAGFQFDITPPALMIGQNMQITDDLEALIVPVLLECGKFEINVAVQEKK